MENTFGVMIFPIFWFQKNALIKVEKLVEKNFSYLKVEYVVSVMWPSSQIIATESQLSILEFYERYYVKSGLIIK